MENKQLEKILRPLSWVLNNTKGIKSFIEREGCMHQRGIYKVLTGKDHSYFIRIMVNFALFVGEDMFWKTWQEIGKRISEIAYENSDSFNNYYSKKNGK